MLVNGGFSGESAIDNSLYEGGRRGTKRSLEDYDNGKIVKSRVKMWRA